MKCFLVGQREIVENKSEDGGLLRWTHVFQQFELLPFAEQLACRILVGLDLGNEALLVLEVALNPLHLLVDDGFDPVPLFLDELAVEQVAALHTYGEVALDELDVGSPALVQAVLAALQASVEL